MKKLKKNRRVMIATGVFLLCLSQSGISAAIPLERPDAGKTIGSLQDLKPTMEKTNPIIDVGTSSQQLPTTVGEKIHIASIHITGQTIYSEEKLLPLVQGSFDKELTLDELHILADKIGMYFRSQGYLVANAIIPVQDIKEDRVEIQVIVGQYSKIEIRNHSQLATAQINSLLSGLKSGDYIENIPLERGLFLLNDIGGISAKATLAPGESAGTSELIVDVVDTAKFSGVLSADNFTNRFTGEKHLGLTLDIHNVSGSGDEINLNGGLTENEGLRNYSVAYQLPIGSRGGKLGASYSQMNYALGEDFAQLDASGMAKVTGVYATYPILRSRDFNLNGRISYDNKRLQDVVNYNGSDSKKRANVWSFTLNGDSRDQLGGGGVNSFGLTFASGRLEMDSAYAQVNDEKLQTAGGFAKGNIVFARGQYLANRLNLYLSFNGQMASKNLDSSEKMSLGGANGVRAYPQGEGSGDSGYVFTSELRWNLPTPAFQLVAFYDNGGITINKNPIVGAGMNSRNLSGAGLGFIWNKPSDYSLRVNYAWKISSDTATSDTDENGRLWLQASKYF